MKIAFSFFLLIYSRCGAPASWAARHTIVCLDMYICHEWLNCRQAVPCSCMTGYFDATKCYFINFNELNVDYSEEIIDHVLLKVLVDS